MARATVEQKGLDRWLYRIGYASARVSDVLQQARDAVGDVAGRARGVEEDVDDGADDADAAFDERFEAIEEQVGSLAATTALGVVLAQLLRPRPVNWPRALLAGTIGTLLYDAETLVESRLGARKFRTSSAGGGRTDTDALAGRFARYAAGIGMASFYARYLYGRLPGPPLVQGVAYGVLESGARNFGGVVALLNRLSPEVRLPSGYTAGLDRGTEGTLELVRRHLAFGIGVGLVYRK